MGHVSRAKRAKLNYVGAGKKARGAVARGSGLVTSSDFRAHNRFWHFPGPIRASDLIEVLMRYIEIGLVLSREGIWIVFYPTFDFFNTIQ